MVKCEKWIQDDRSKESTTSWWLNRLIGRTKKASLDWPFPFVEDRMFVLTLTAGLEGYHVNVDGRHVTSFPYRIVSGPFMLTNRCEVLMVVHWLIIGGVCRDLGLRMRLAYH
jgi:hypothetical protein